MAYILISKVMCACKENTDVHNKQNKNQLHIKPLL